MRLEAVLAADLAMVAVFFVYAEAQVDLDGVCLTTLNCIKGAQCFKNKCKCLDHEICMTKFPSEVCTLTETTIFCEEVKCSSQRDCLTWPGTQCLQTQFSEGKICTLPNQDADGDADGDTSTKAQNQTKAVLGESCSTTDDCVSGAECLSNTCKCKDHEICIQQDPSKICDKEGDDATCKVVHCTAQSNCSAWAGTECRQTEFSQNKTCTLPKGGTKNTSDEDVKTQQQKDFEDLLMLSFVLVGASILSIVICFGLIWSGKCSGDPASKPVKGRGVPLLKRRIPRLLGGTKQPTAARKKSRKGSAGKNSMQMDPVSMSTSEGPSQSEVTASDPSMSGFSTSEPGVSVTQSGTSASGTAGWFGIAEDGSSMVDTQNR